MPNLIDTSTSTPAGTANSGSSGRQLVQTSDGYYATFYYPGSNQLKYSVTNDNGLTWSDPITVASDLTSTGIRVSIDSSNNIHLINHVISGTNINLRYIKLTYQGDGVWTAGSWKTVYTGNQAETVDIIVDSGNRVWVAIREYNFATATWNDLKVTYSDNDGDSWASLTTIITDSGDGWNGYRPSFGLRQGRPVIVYGNGSNEFSIREWNGSAWGSQVTATGAEGFFLAGSVVSIGSTAYVVYSQAQEPKSTYLRTWNGSSLGSRIQIYPGKCDEVTVGTDGTDLFIIMKESTPWQGGVISTRFVHYVIATGRKKHQFIIDDTGNNDTTDISAPDIARTFTGYPMLTYAKDESGTKLYSIYFDFDFGIKISKSGYDVYDADQKQILHSSYPQYKSHLSGTGTLVKSGGQSVRTVEITHNLGYIPRCFVYGHYLDMNAYPTATVKARYKLFSWRDTPGLRLWDYYRFWADENKLYIRYITNSFVSSSISLPYIYFIFKDEG